MYAIKHMNEYDNLRVHVCSKEHSTVEKRLF